MNVFVEKLQLEAIWKPFVIYFRRVPEKASTKISFATKRRMSHSTKSLHVKVATNLPAIFHDVLLPSPPKLRASPSMACALTISLLPPNTNTLRSSQGNYKFWEHDSALSDAISQATPMNSLSIRSVVGKSVSNGFVCIASIFSAEMYLFRCAIHKLKSPVGMISIENFTICYSQIDWALTWQGS